MVNDVRWSHEHSVCEGVERTRRQPVFDHFPPGSLSLETPTLSQPSKGRKKAINAVTRTKHYTTKRLGSVSRDGIDKAAQFVPLVTGDSCWL